ncbi:pyridoxal-dependent decarboxylase [Flavobacterium sp. LS1R49]|uniref:Pyridoxal-dependent decarboxylase n=1 Tax=Flavobacterium shii TaxID=2987687 RepID=A0A9X2ZJ97_9FLAO|nr:pyridoxal-dependent decarboxylase [Flavobacterium shii]MCV9928628.1 pyridoxal-dependent decarboxylase [Flavobacterium shii]
MTPNSQILEQKKIDNLNLFDASSKTEYQNSIHKTTEYVLGFLDNSKFYSGATVSELRDKKRIISVSSDETLTLDEALKDIKELYLDHAISFHNTSYVAHLNCPILIPALVGDLIATAVNTAVETWDQSTSATLIEQEIINWISGEFQLPHTSDGVFTNGGTQSNFMALLMARDHYAYQNFGINIKENGLNEIVSKFRFFCSEKAHFSIQKNAALLGMGYQSVIKVKADSDYKMDPEALLLAIEREKQLGNIPIAVVATTGTTDFGSFDPVEIISKIAKDYKMWLHVDGAYGGCYILTDTHKHLLEGAKFADSITVDFHKTLFQPVCSSAFLVADKSNFKYVSHYADYLNPIETKDDEYQNLIVKSVQTTRRFDALKLWFTLKITGKKKLAEYLEMVHYKAIEAHSILGNDAAFETIHKPQLSTVVFRYKAQGIADDKIHDTVNLYIKNTLFKSGEASVASTKLNGNIYLKFTLLNPKITTEDIQHIVSLMKQKGDEYQKSN